MRRISRARRPLVALVGLIALVVIGYLVQGGGSGTHGPSSRPPSTSATSGSTPGSRSGSTPGSRSDSAGVALSSLPVQARETVRLIQGGGPFPYPSHDGVVFHNYDHTLPVEQDGWYHEYTVPTPGVSTRGARRMITGKDGSYWYTADHYDTFRRVDVNR